MTGVEMRRSLICLVCVVIILSCSREAEKKEPRELFRVRQSDKIGYVNRKGRVVIQPQFEESGEFAEGLAGVRIGSKWGYINEKGKIVINPQFDAVGEFSDGLAAFWKLRGSGHRDRCLSGPSRRPSAARFLAAAGQRRVN